jgi:hypothetical protein
VKTFLAQQTSLLYNNVLKKLRNGIWTMCKTGSGVAEGTLEIVCG